MALSYNELERIKGEISTNLDELTALFNDFILFHFGLNIGTRIKKTKHSVSQKRKKGAKTKKTRVTRRKNWGSYRRA